MKSYGVALQGLAGLQFQEATRLTWDRVNLEAGLIEISGEVKNVYRNRIIPVADRMLDALKRAKQRNSSMMEGKARPVREHVLVSQKGRPYEDWFMNYSNEVSAAIKEWNPKVRWKPNDLRNCLPTFAFTQGLQNDMWEQYIGHVPRSVTARHYIPRLTSASLGEKQALEKQKALFRLHVASPVNRAIESHQRGEVLNRW